MMTKASFTNEQWRTLCSLAQIGPVDKKLFMTDKDENQCARICCVQYKQTNPELPSPSSSFRTNGKPPYANDTPTPRKGIENSSSLPRSSYHDRCDLVCNLSKMDGTLSLEPTSSSAFSSYNYSFSLPFAMSVVGGNPKHGLVKHETTNGRHTWWTYKGEQIVDVSSQPTISIVHPPLAGTGQPSANTKPSHQWLAEKKQTARSRFTLAEFEQATPAKRAKPTPKYDVQNYVLRLRGGGGGDDPMSDEEEDEETTATMFVEAPDNAQAGMGQPASTVVLDRQNRNINSF